MSKNRIIPRAPIEEEIEEQYQQESDSRQELQEQVQDRPKTRFSKILGSGKKIIDGSIILNDDLQKHWKIILYCFSLCVFLIFNNYTAERKAREVVSLRKELTELRFRKISTKSQVMGLSRQSYIAQQLEGIGLKESVVPPVKISYQEDQH